MSDDKHTIKKAVVEVYLRNAADASDAQNKALSFFKEKIIPMIEKIIDRMGFSGEVIRIENLSLDLKNFSLQHTSEQAMHNFQLQVEEKLAKLISEERGNEHTEEIITGTRKITKDKAVIGLFIHLLKTGSLPWWAKTEDTVSVKTLAAQLLEQSPEALKAELIAVLAMPAVRKRIAWQLSGEQNEKIIALLSNGSSSSLVPFINAILEFIKEQVAPVSMQPLLSEFALQQIHYSSMTGSLTLQEFIAGFLKEPGKFALAEKMYAACKAPGVAASGMDVIVKRALAAADEHFAGRLKKIFSIADVNVFFMTEKLQEENYNATVKKEVKAKTSDDDTTAGTAKAAEETIGAAKARKEKTAGEKKDTSADNDKEAAPGKKAAGAQRNRVPDVFPEELFAQQDTGDYFIKNAGLVIIAPYLPSLFKELGLSDGKTFVSEEARERSVLLIQFLATGNEEGAGEHEMIFNKILCGFDRSTPLTLPFLLSEREREECQNLLQAVADNWPALRGTSGAGMRDAFFMRDGILQQQSNGWDLRIEKTTIDILLDKLPWGISVIQMPWSRAMIFVSW